MSEFRFVDLFCGGGGDQTQQGAARGTGRGSEVREFRLMDHIMKIWQKTGKHK